MSMLGMRVDRRVKYPWGEAAAFISSQFILIKKCLFRYIARVCVCV